MNSLQKVLSTLQAALQYLSGILERMKPVPVTTTTTPTAPAPVKPAPKPTTPTVNPDALNPWDQSIAGNEHNVRALCDLANVNLEGKNIISACVEIESNFQNYYIGTTNPVIHRNILNGRVESTDWGIVQINDFYHIGPGKDFASTDYVLANPTATVNYMIRMYKAGKINMWSSYVGLMKGEYPAIAAKYGIKVG